MSKTKIERKSFNTPDETQTPSKFKSETVKLGGFTVTRMTAEPGWKWSTDIKPIVKTDSCQIQHTGVVISGRINVRMNDDTEIEYGPGDVMSIPPGHDGWVVGNEPFVGIEWSESTD